VETSISFWQDRPGIFFSLVLLIKKS